MAEEFHLGRGLSQTGMAKEGKKEGEGGTFWLKRRVKTVDEIFF